jgi:hypothetical protein
MPVRSFRRPIALAATAGILGAAAVAFVAAPASGAVLPVTDDATLRAAILAAVDGDEIVFSAGATIVIEPNLPVLDDDVSIVGNGATVQGLDGDITAFTVAEADVSFTDLTIRQVSESITAIESSLSLAGVTIEDSAFGLVVENTVPGLTVDVADSTFQRILWPGAQVRVADSGTVSIVRSSFVDNDDAGLLLEVHGGEPAVLTDLVLTGNGADGLRVGVLGSSAIATAANLLATGNGVAGVNASAIDGGAFFIADSRSEGNRGNGIEAFAFFGGRIDVFSTQSLGNDDAALAVDAGEGTVLVEDSTLSGSVEHSGVDALLGDSSLTLLRTTIADNRAFGIEAAISGASSLTLDTSVVSGSGASGIGVSATDGSAVAIVRSEVTSSAFSGVAIEVGGSATALVDSSTVFGNVGDGLNFYAFAGTSVDIVDSTISGTLPNPSGLAWGTTFEGPGVFSLRNSTVTANGNVADGAAVGIFDGATGTISHTIIAGNSPGSGHELYLAADVGIVELDWSLIGTIVDESASLVIGAGVTTGVTDPRLGPLADNGGPTLTHLPTSSSPAVNGGDPSIVGAPATDQRGEARIQGGRIDIGSVEIPIVLPVTGSPLPIELIIVALGMLLLGGAAFATLAMRRVQSRPEWSDR